MHGYIYNTCNYQCLCPCHDFEHTFSIFLSLLFSCRLREFNRSQVLDFNPYDNGDNVQSHSTGTGPGLGQRLSIDDIREQQKSIIAGNCHVTNCHVNNCFFL